MKKLFMMMALAAISLPLMLTSCSGSGNATLDKEKITQLSKSGSDLTEDDYDFLLDQLEIILKPSKDMTPEDRKNYVLNLDNDFQEAMIIIAFGLQGGIDKDKLSNKQIKRYNKLEEEYSTK